MAEYRYDAYGNCLSVSGSNDEVASCNPFRYRSYYYDDDTGLYYLNARYYNPKLRRFISPDNSAYLDTGSPQGLNLYVYCGNDPVSHSDPSGRFGVLTALIIGAIAGAVVGFGIATYIDYMDDNEVFNGSVPWYNYVGAALLGGIIGGGIGASIPYLVAFAGASAFGSVPVAGGAVAIAVSAEKVILAGAIGTATVGYIGANLLFAKGYGPRIGHNQHENRQFDQLCREHHLSKDEARRLHDYISHQNYSYREIEEIIFELFRK